MSAARKKRGRTDHAPQRRVDLLAKEMKRLGADMTPASIPTPERIAKGDLSAEAIVDYELTEDPKAPPRRVVKGVAVMDKTVHVGRRLARFEKLNDAQRDAGKRLARDWETAGLERRIVANLLGVPGGSGAGPEIARIEAAGRVRDAVNTLSISGKETVRIVLAVLIEESTVVDAGRQAHASDDRAKAHAAALLSAGLSVLAHYYAASDKRARQKAAAAA